MLHAIFILRLRWIKDSWAFIPSPSFLLEVYCKSVSICWQYKLKKNRKYCLPKDGSLKCSYYQSEYNLIVAAPNRVFLLIAIYAKVKHHFKPLATDNLHQLIVLTVPLPRARPVTPEELQEEVTEFQCWSCSREHHEEAVWTIIWTHSVKLVKTRGNTVSVVWCVSCRKYFPDHSVTIPGFRTFQADRDISLSSKKKCTGTALVVIAKWCNPRHVLWRSLSLAWILNCYCSCWNISILLAQGNPHCCCCLNPVWMNALFRFLHQLRSRSSKRLWDCAEELWIINRYWSSSAL